MSTSHEESSINDVASLHSSSSKSLGIRDVRPLYISDIFAPLVGDGGDIILYDTEFSFVSRVFYMHYVCVSLVVVVGSVYIFICTPTIHQTSQQDHQTFPYEINKKMGGIRKRRHSVCVKVGGPGLMRTLAQFSCQCFYYYFLFTLSTFSKTFSVYGSQ